MLFENRPQIMRKIDVFFIIGPLHSLASWLKTTNRVYRYSFVPIAPVLIKQTVTDFTTQNARYSRTDCKSCEKSMFSLSLNRFAAWTRDWKRPIGYATVSFLESHHFSIQKMRHLSLWRKTHAIREPTAHSARNRCFLYHWTALQPGLVIENAQLGKSLFLFLSRIACYNL